MSNPEKLKPVGDQDSVSTTSEDDEMAPTCGPCDCPPTAFYSLGTALLVIGGLLLVIFCSELVPDNEFSRDFKKTKCTVVSAAFVDDACCENEPTRLNKCEKGYDYPCARITVTYTDGGDDVSAVLYDELKSRVYRSYLAKENECSYFHCGSESYRKHKNNAKDFLEKYDNKVGDKVDCYTDAKTHKHVALADIPSTAAFGTLLTISVILITAGAIICIAMFIIVKIKMRHIHALQDEKRLLRRGDNDENATRSQSTSAGSDLTGKTGSGEKKRPATKTGVRFEIKSDN